MITYEYKCEACEYVFEAQQSIKEEPLSTCPQCLRETINRVIYPGIVFVKEGITDKTTLGKLAEHNTKKLGKYEKQEKREAQREAKEKGKEKLQHDMADKLGTKPIDVKKKPWYRKVGADKINKMTPEQKEKYIQKGE